MTAPAWRARQGSPGAARSTGSQALGSLLCTQRPELQLSPKAFQNRRETFILRAFKKKKKTKNPTKKTTPQSLVSHKERKEGKKISCKTRNTVKGVLWYKGTIQYEHIIYVQPCQQHGVRCQVQSGARHPHQGLQTESAVPGGGPGGEAAVAAVGGPPYRGSTAPPGAKAVLGMRKANCPSEAGSSWKPP